MIVIVRNTQVTGPDHYQRAIDQALADFRRRLESGEQPRVIRGGEPVAHIDLAQAKKSVKHDQ